MSGVNSKCSRGDLTQPSKDPLEDLSSTLARITLTEQMEPETSPKSPADQVLRIPYYIPELLPGIFGYLAEHSNLEQLLNLRLVCPLWKRQVFLALKSNLALLPWVGVDKMRTAMVIGANAFALASETDREFFSLPKSLDIESYIRNVKPGCGVPIKVLINNWTLELASFLRDFSSDIISVWMCGSRLFTLYGFPDDLGGIELPSLEHASFCGTVCAFDGDCDEFGKALAFWKMLCTTSKKLQTCHLDIGIPLMGCRLILPDHKVFKQLEWSGVNSLSCTYEFFAKVSASNELSALHKLECGSTWDGAVSVPLETQISLEKAANLTELTLRSKIDWLLNHPLENLKVLTLENVTITCVLLPSVVLPKLEKVTVVDMEDVRLRSSISCLISGGGVFDNVVELNLTELWVDLNEGLEDLAVQLFDSFPKLTKLDWKFVAPMFSNQFQGEEFDNMNALRAAPVIFSKLENLTALKLMVSSASERDVVELVTGVHLEEMPEEEDSWPNALVGNSRSITNLKHLQSFHLNVKWERGLITVTGGHSRFLFTAAFFTMATLKELCFFNIRFEDTSCATEWQQMGRKIKIAPEYEILRALAEVSDPSSGDDWGTTDYDFELDDDDE